MDASAFVFARLANETSADSRVYPLLLPQNPTFPAITYQRISSIKTHAMGQDGQITRVRVQVNVWGATYAEAWLLSIEARLRLSRFKGIVGGVNVLDVFIDNEQDIYESETRTLRVVLDCMVFLGT